jgi:hypothetical protein
VNAGKGGKTLGCPEKENATHNARREAVEPTAEGSFLNFSNGRIFGIAQRP